MNPLRVTVFFFHPFPSRSRNNLPLWKAIQGIPGVETRDMYALYPEFQIDVEAEQKVLLRTDVAVFQHPFYWYNSPSLMKEWLDSVLEHGWAYGPGGTHLEGKYWLHAITTGGTQDAYTRAGNNRFSVLELLRPFEQSARLCGLTPLTPFITHGANVLSDADRVSQAAKYRELLTKIARGELPSAYRTDDSAEVR